MDHAKHREIFKDIFSTESSYDYFSPGRINLIGEHIDYHGGHVLPASITLGTYAYVSTRNDKSFGFYSLNFIEINKKIFSPKNIKYDSNDTWMNYPKGILKALKERGYSFDYGLNIMFYGNIPNGSGLSSSASLEILMLWIINKQYNLNLSKIEMAKIAKEVENKFIGVQSGIMDQFAVVLGKKNHALLLNTKTMEYQYTPIKLKDVSIVIMNTNKQRGLEDSDYNVRRRESELGFDIIKEHFEVDYLCDLQVNQLEEVEILINNSKIFKRVKHVVTENKRTLDAVIAMKKNNLQKFGDLLVESHLSLKNDYEVTGIELDTLVFSALHQQGVFGARMTGAGFGGAAIAIVKNKDINTMIKNVSKEYKDIMGYSADFYIADISDGVKSVQ